MFLTLNIFGILFLYTPSISSNLSAKLYSILKGIPGISYLLFLLGIILSDVNIGVKMRVVAPQILIRITQVSLTDFLVGEHACVPTLSVHLLSSSHRTHSTEYEHTHNHHNHQVPTILQQHQQQFYNNINNNWLHQTKKKILFLTD